MPLSKSAFTIMPSCVSTFSTPMSSYTSLNILNILLTSLCSPPSLTAPFGVSVHVLPCCAFPSVGHAAYLQFHYSLFLPTLYSGHKILLLSCSNTFLVLIPFLQLHPSFYTLYTPLLSSLLSLLLLLSSSMLLDIGHTTHFLLLSQEGILIPDFHGSVLPCLCILYSLHILSPPLLLSIFSLAGVHLWRAYSPPYCHKLYLDHNSGNT